MPYADVYERSVQDPEGFWAEAAKAIHWDRPWEQVLDRSGSGVPRWFAGARLNTCYNAVDRHVEAGHGEQLALVYDSPVTGTQAHVTYRELQDQVARCAGVLAQMGVTHGDRVLLYMPMVPEAVVGMLACARLGAVHSVVFGGFASVELAKRIDDAQPKVLLSASCGLEPTRTVNYKPLLDAAMDAASHKPERCLILQRPEAPCDLTPDRDLDWREAISSAQPHPCVSVQATDPLYILYTSGTTGDPKGIVRDNGGHAVALAWSMKHVYGVDPGETFWAASDVGWVVGHSYIVYGPLLHRATTVLYEGKPVGTPDAGAFWRVIQEHKVRVFFTAPTAFRAIKQQDPHAEKLRDYDCSGLRALFLAGERCDPNTLEWAADTLKVPVIDHWWQTETGWPVAANCLGIEALPIKPGSPTKAVPGWNIQVVDPESQPVSANTIGNIVLKLPLPPGALPTLWNAEARFQEVYLKEFPGFYKTSDAGYLDEEGYVYVMSRTDDVINVAGHRLSTGAMEEVLAAHPAVAECAVIGVRDELKGQRPVALLVLKAGAKDPPAEVEAQAVQLVRDRIGPVAALKHVHVVERLPKTRSGKILRRTLRQIADGDAYTTPATVDDPEILTAIAKSLSPR